MKNEKGLTLIETLVAVAVFSVAATAMTALHTTAFATADWNKERAHALAIVQSEFEAFRSLTYAELGTQAAFRLEDCGARSCGVTRTVTLDRPAPGMAEVTIGITWSGRNGARTSYVARTIITAIQR